MSEAAALVRRIVAREAVPGPALEAAGLLDTALPPTERVEIAAALATDAGLEAALELLDASDLVMAAALCGTAQAALDAGMAYARDRVVFGRPLARFPVQRAAFAAATAHTDAALALVRRAAAGAGVLDVAAAVPAAAAAAWLAVETALQVHGGYGYTDEYPISRMWREVVAVRARLSRPAYDEAVTRAAGPAM